MKAWPKGNAGAKIERMAEVGADVGERLERRLQVLQVRAPDRRLRVVDQPGRGVAERAELVQRGGELRPLLDQHVQRGRNLVQRPVDDVASARRTCRRAGSAAGWTRRCCRAARPASPTKLSSRVSSSRISGSRPDSAALKLWMMSPIWPSPPPLTTADSDDSVCSVDG